MAGEAGVGGVPNAHNLRPIMARLRVEVTSPPVNVVVMEVRDKAAYKLYWPGNQPNTLSALPEAVFQGWTLASTSSKSTTSRRRKWKRKNTGAAVVQQNSIALFYLQKFTTTRH